MKEFSSHSNTYYDAATHPCAGSARAAKGRETETKQRAEITTEKLARFAALEFMLEGSAWPSSAQLSLAQPDPAQLSSAQLSLPGPAIFP